MGAGDCVYSVVQGAVVAHACVCRSVYINNMINNHGARLRVLRRKVRLYADASADVRAFSLHEVVFGSSQKSPLLRMSMPSDAAANWMPLSRGTSRPLYPTIGAPLPRRTSVPMPRSVSLPSHRRLPLIDHASSSVTSAAALANERWQAQT
eukprot:scaffold6648_cov63-Phaeocystis_antarctica.AAC.2